jgi:hypothetical protein
MVVKQYQRNSKIISESDGNFRMPDFGAVSFFTINHKKLTQAASVKVSPIILLIDVGFPSVKHHILMQTETLKSDNFMWLINMEKTYNANK